MKAKLRSETGPLSGFVNVIPSAVATQAIAAAGADWILVDQEHGMIGPESMHAMIAATAGTKCSPLVRVGKRDEALVKTALDAGAEGLMFPLVRTAQEAAECVALTRYPPAGRRGWGPFVAHSRWQVELGDYLAERGGETAVILLIETRDAVRNIEEIARVDGVDGMFIAQFDLSNDLGVPGQFDSPEFIAAFDEAERAILEAGIPVGAVAFTREQTHRILARGHRLLGHNFDVLMLKDVVRESMGWVRDAAPALAPNHHASRSGANR